MSLVNVLMENCFYNNKQKAFNGLNRQLISSFSSTKGWKIWHLIKISANARPDHHISESSNFVSSAKSEALFPAVPPNSLNLQLQQSQTVGLVSNESWYANVLCCTRLS